MQLDDEEKCFDGINGAMQVLSLRSYGYPEHGFAEICMDDLDNKDATIVTRQGEVNVHLATGVQQGSTISCVISNPTTRFKFLA